MGRGREPRRDLAGRACVAAQVLPRRDSPAAAAMRSGLATLLAVVSLHTWTALALRVLDHRLFGATRTIKLKPCQNRVTGVEGTCMFAWDCFSAGGTHLTYCTDSFYTGSCCKLPPGVSVQQHDTPSEPTNSIDSMPYESDEDYKKRTKRPPSSTTRTTVLFTKTTKTPGTAATYAATTTTKPSHTPAPTTPESTVFVGLSTFTPGLITWRPHETTLPYVSDEPFTTVPNDRGSSTSAPESATSTTTAIPTTKTTRPAATTTRIPIMASTFLTTEGTTETQPMEFTYEVTTKAATDGSTEGTSKATETTVSGTTSQVYTTPTEAPSTETCTNDSSTIADVSTQRPSTSSVQSHTWIVNERETTMAIPQSVPTEHTWVVVDEADPGGQQTTTPAPSEPTTQSTSSTASMADWSTVTDTVTSISWVDMTELSTTQKPPPDGADSTSLPSKPPTEEPADSTTASVTVATTPRSTTGTGSTETDPVTVRPESESPLAEFISPTEGQASTKGETTTSTQTTSTQKQTPTTQPATSQPSTSTVEVTTATTTRRKPIPITFAPTTHRTTTAGSTETTTAPTTTITTPRTTWKYTTVPTYTVSEERTTTTQAPTTTTRKATTAPSTVQSTLPKTTPTTPVPTTRTTSGPTTLSPDKDIRKICGRPRTLPSARIVGGEQTKFAQWPWMISLRQFKRNNFLHKCGAALLNEYWAISAAHCVHNVSPTDILLRLGEYDLKSDREALPHVERRVQIVATHPRFDASTFEYDLALLRLYEPVPFQDNVLPVCVPDTNDTFVGRSAVVTGWGRLYEDGPLPSIMQKVSVPIITNKECESMYRKAGFIEDIPNIFICAGLAKGGKDSCEGDSGGPLVLKDPKTGQWSLVGIISWGIGCALPNQPGVYTRITHFADWIRQIIVF